MAAFADEAAAVRASLLETARRDVDLGVRASAVYSLSSRPAAEPDEAAPFLTDGEPLLGAVAAIVVARRFGPRSPLGTVAAIAGALDQREVLRSPYAAVAFAHGDLLSDLAVAAGSVRGAEACALAPLLCQLLDTVSPMDAIPGAHSTG